MRTYYTKIGVCIVVFMLTLFFLANLSSAVSGDSFERHLVMFEVDDGSIETYATYVEHNTNVARPFFDPIKTGNVFLGWYLNDEEFDFDNYVVVSDIVIKARYQRVYTVEVVNEAFEVTSRYSVYPGETISAPLSLTKENYQFLGWYCDGELYDFSQAVDHDICLVPVFEINRYHVVLVVNGGFDQEEFDVEHNQIICPPTKYTRNLFEIEGWYFENVDLYQFCTPVRQDTILVAEWVTHVSNETELVAAINEAKADDVIYITNDFEVTQDITFTGVDFIIDGQDFTLTFENGAGFINHETARIYDLSTSGWQP